MLFRSIGLASSITGSVAYYAGGGGAQGNTSGGAGGLGGGGAGGTAGGNSGNGSDNTGGGGGGRAAGGTGGLGGSGVIIISYCNPTQLGTGGTVTSYSLGGLTYWVHTFTTSGTFTA